MNFNCQAMLGEQHAILAARAMHSAYVAHMVCIKTLKIAIMYKRKIKEWPSA